MANYGFESGTLSSWAVENGATASIVTSTVHSGSYSAATTGAGNAGLYQAVSGLIAGRQYVVSAWVNVTAGQMAALYVNDSVSNATAESADQGTTNGWQYISLPFTADSTGEIGIHLWSAGAGTIYWDDISILGNAAYTISGQVLAGGSGLSGATVTLTGTTATGASVSLSTTTDSNGNYSFTVPAGGTYIATPSLAGYTFNPASQTFSNVSANQTPGPFQDVPQPVCATQASVSSPITAGQTEVISVTLSSGASEPVTFSITGATTNPYSNSIAATKVGNSATYQATLSTNGLLGEYKIVPIVNNAACSNATNFFNISTGTEPSQPGSINCASMTGRWTDAASGQPDLFWSLVDSGGDLSGTATSQDSCGNTITWNKVAGTYNAARQQYTLTATGAASHSCGGETYTPQDQIVTGTVQQLSCGLGSGTFQAGTGIVSNPPGTVNLSGPNALTIPDRIPDGENTIVTNTQADWLDQYGRVTTAQFNMDLSSSAGYNFGGRTVTETPGLPSQGSDDCTYQGAPWAKMVTLNVVAPYPSWNVQDNGKNGNYGPDLVGLTADQVAYIQAFNTTLGSGCTVSYPQIMEIDSETENPPSKYGSSDNGNNTITFTVSPTSISVQRGSATVTRPFHF